MQRKDDSFDVIIIGAGIAGVTSALELAKTRVNGRKLKIALIEAGPEVLPATCSTQNECNKLHTGMHYLGDIKTGEHCLENAIEFAKKYPQFLAGKDEAVNPCLGRHYVLDSSLVTPDEARKVADRLRSLYKKKVEEDPNNQVFGTPENFICEINPEEYDFLSTTIPVYDSKKNRTSSTVAVAFQTTEAQVDIPRLQKHLQQQVLETKNITFIPNTYVTKVGLNEKGFGYNITANQLGSSSSVKYEARGIVNCSWQNAAVLDKDLESHFDKENSSQNPGVNRVKVSIEVELPEELQGLNTCLFSTGPFFSITNLGNGKAILTSERFTNIGHYPVGVAMPEEMSQQIDKLRSIPLSNEARELAGLIIDDCAACFKDKYKALFLQVKSSEIKMHVGIVNIPNLDKEYRDDDIFSRNSSIHARQSSGVMPKALGYFTHLSLKMTNAGRNPNIVAELMASDLNLIEKYEAWVSLIKYKVGCSLPEGFHEKISMTEIDDLLYRKYRQQILDVVRALEEEQIEDQGLKREPSSPFLMVEGLMKEIMDEVQKMSQKPHDRIQKTYSELPRNLLFALPKARSAKSDQKFTDKADNRPNKPATPEADSLKF